MPDSKHQSATISDRLRQAMEEKRLRDGKRVTVQQLADAAGVSRASASLWLNNPGPEGPKRAAIERLARFFGVSAGWLEHGDSAPSAIHEAMGVPDPRTVALLSPTARHARNLPLSVREYLIELRRRLTRADVPDEAIDEAIELLRSPQVFSFFVGGTAREFPESDVLANVKTFAEESIIPTLRRRGFKL